MLNTHFKLVDSKCLVIICTIFIWTKCMQVELHPPINSRNWISCVRLDYTLRQSEGLHHANCVTNQWPIPRKSVFLQVPWNSANVWSVLFSTHSYLHFVLKPNSKLACLLQILPILWCGHSKTTTYGIYPHHLEYATTVWDPHLSNDKQELESVQHFACRVLPKVGMKLTVICCVPC